jgi:hypothetical protein
MYFYKQINKKIERFSIKYFNLTFKIFKKCSAMLSTVSSEMAQKVLNGVRKRISRSWLGKWTVYKIKILPLSKSTNKNFINPHLPWLKYFLLITLKRDMRSTDSCICYTKLLIKRAGFTVLYYMYISCRCSVCRTFSHSSEAIIMKR